MSRVSRIAISALVCLLVLSSGRVHAQRRPAPFGQRSYVPYPRAQLSPYLDLLRGGNPAANYYLGTIPEIERRQNTAIFRSAIRDLDARQNELATQESEDLRTGLPATGHAAVFNNLGGYFNTGVPPLGNIPPRPAAAGGPKKSR